MRRPAYYSRTRTGGIRIAPARRADDDKKHCPIGFAGIAGTPPMDDDDDDIPVPEVPPPGGSS